MAKKLTLVLADELHTRLRFLATRERRSLHSQILYLLESHTPEFSESKISLAQSGVEAPSSVAWKVADNKVNPEDDKYLPRP